MKTFIQNLLEHSLVRKFLIFLIMLSLVVFVFDTDYDFHDKYYHFVYMFEIFAITIFTVEYALRVASLKKAKDIFSPLMLIDLLAILPFFVTFLPLESFFLRALRMFRLFSVFKLGRYTKAFIHVRKAFASRKGELAVAGMIFFSAVLASSTLMHYAEGHVNPEFDSILSSFWWSVITLTSVGYGDVYPITTFGKFIASCTAIMGIGLQGLLVGIIGAAFMSVVNKRIKEPASSQIKVREQEKHTVNA